MSLWSNKTTKQSNIISSQSFMSRKDLEIFSRSLSFNFEISSEKQCTEKFLSCNKWGSNVNLKEAGCWTNPSWTAGPVRSVRASAFHCPLDQLLPHTRLPLLFLTSTVTNRHFPLHVHHTKHLYDAMKYVQHGAHWYRKIMNPLSSTNPKSPSPNLFIYFFIFQKVVRSIQTF